jgi:hypothetical protein
MRARGVAPGDVIGSAKGRTMIGVAQAGRLLKDSVKRRLQRLGLAVLKARTWSRIEERLRVAEAGRQQANAEPQACPFAAQLAPLLQQCQQLAAAVRETPPPARMHCRGMAAHPLFGLIESVAPDLNLAYSPGKVGSQTIAATIESHPAIGGTAWHVHYLADLGFSLLDSLIGRLTRAKRPGEEILREQFLRGKWVRTLLAANALLRAVPGAGGKAIRKPFVLTGVREPVAMHLSFLFEVSWMYTQDPGSQIDAAFVRARLADDAWHRWCNDWFGGELKEVFGIDVYARPFPADRGWEIYENDRARVMLIRLESFDRLPEALGAMYGLDPATVTIHTRNTTDSKAYARRYAELCNTLTLSDAELEAAYSLPYVRHFYTPHEIRAFKDRWRARKAYPETRTRAA